MKPSSHNSPDAGQPVRSQAEDAHQQHQHGRPVLNVVVQFAGDPTQAEQPDHLQRAEQAADALHERGNEKVKHFDCPAAFAPFFLACCVMQTLTRDLFTVFAFIITFSLARPCASSFMDGLTASNASPLGLIKSLEDQINSGCSSHTDFRFGSI